MSLTTFSVLAIMAGGYFIGDAIRRGHYGWAGLLIASAVLVLTGLILTVLGY